MIFLRKLKRIFNLIRIIINSKNREKYFNYKLDKSIWLKKGGTITKEFMILTDYADNSGKANGHYFHQDLLVAKFINESNPKRYIDIGSRVDGFIAHLASFREIEVNDIIPFANNIYSNMQYIRADLMNPI